MYPTSWIINIKLRFYASFLVIIPTILLCPTALMISIHPKEVNSELFYWKLSEISQTDYVKVYFLILVLIENILPLIILVTLTMFCQSEYKNRMRIKSKMISQSLINFEKLQNAYTRIAIILTVLFIITRLSDFAVKMLIRSIFLLDLKLDRTTLSVIYMIRQLKFLVYFGLHSFNQLLCVQIDQNLKILANDFFSKIKVIFYKLTK